MPANIDLPFWETVVRLILATVCGGMIGIERGRKHRPAGFRTHMIVCIGAALTMVLSVYISDMIVNVWKLEESQIKIDVSRLGAQVIHGIGFLGAGTIIVTGRQQIKGLTTAAGLWASACMGLAIGAGFYIGALVACIFMGFCVSMLWPGTLIFMEENMPHLGVAAYALMAAGGDMGASVAPQLMGVVVDGVSQSNFALSLAQKLSITPTDVGMKAGMLVSSLFPLVGILVVIFLIRYFKKEKKLSN